MKIAESKYGKEFMEKTMVQRTYNEITTGDQGRSEGGGATPSGPLRVEGHRLVFFPGCAAAAILGFGM
jgi:hypothetical protein